MKKILVVFLSVIAFTQGWSWAPDYLIIGAQKSGTSALKRYIYQHPQALPQDGEIHFFDFNFHKGESWYKKKFPKKPSAKFGEKYVIGDKSPYYLFHPLVPLRVKKMYPKVKLIVILRNPVDRAYSHYWFSVRNKKETFPTFEEALAMEPQRLAGEEEKLLNDPLYISYNHWHASYLARGYYAEQIARWQKYFPPHQMLILDASDLRIHPQETLQKVLSFLGIAPFDVSLTVEKKSDYPPMDPLLRSRLYDYFKPLNEELETLLHRKFDWN